MALAATAGVASAADSDARADLSVAVTGPSSVPADQVAAYRVVVSNDGPNQAEDVRVEVRLTRAKAKSVAGSGCELDDTVATCRLGKLKQHGATRQVDLQAVPTDSRPLKVTAVVRSDTGDPNDFNNQSDLDSAVVAGPPTTPTDPPAQGGGDGQTPPTQGGGDGQTPPTQGGGGQTPPTQGGGGGQTPPTQGGGGGQTPPTQGGGGGQTPPTQGGQPPATPGQPAPGPLTDAGSGPLAPGTPFPASPTPPAPQVEVGGTRTSSLLMPFPTVRIAGRLTRTGARVTRLSVNTPPSVRIVFDCRGRTCPDRRSPMRVSASARRPTITVRLREAERTYAAGARLKVAVQRRGRMGKFTSFKIRRGKPPARTDACVAFRSSRPRPCPGT